MKTKVNSRSEIEFFSSPSSNRRTNRKHFYFMYQNGPANFSENWRNIRGAILYVFGRKTGVAYWQQVR
jgi:hypothetical protein